jgi:transcriptional regulator with GAF, ATPase, and Fis domain
VNEGEGLLLNLTLGPVEEGVQVLLVRSGAALGVAVDDLRRALIQDALSRAQGNQARAAKLLGMKYTTFHALARRLGIVKKRGEDSVDAEPPPGDVAVG